MVTGQASAHPVLRKLPARLTPFVGRQADRTRLRDLLWDPAVRLVTIVGVGGIGKTALALEAAGDLLDRFQHGVAFVPLAQTRTVDELLPAVADALDVQLPPSGDLQQAVLDHLAPLQLLLVLDSFEHLLDEASLVREILLAAPGVKVLVTSREKLSLEAETLFTLGGLDVPAVDELPAAGESDAVRLFLQKARQVRPGFSLNPDTAPAVVQLCRMLDGNPLAILLAASCVEHFSPVEILQQARINLDFLAQTLRDAEPRHSCVRAVFDSSFQRLDESQKVAFRKLSIFPGSFDLSAAQAVAGCGLAALISLVDKSLLTRDPASGRYEMHGLLRQYALEQLAAAGEHESALVAHRHYFTEFVCRREPLMIAISQPAVLDEIQSDLDNIRQAWSNVIDRRDFNSASAMMPGLYAFCDMRSRFYEGEAMFRQAVEGLAPQPGEPPRSAWALALLSWYDLRTYIERFASYEELTTQARNCLEVARSIHDPEGEAISHVLLGAMAQHQEDFQAALHHFEEAAQACPALDDFYWLNMRIGIAHESGRQYPQAIQAFSSALQRGQRTGEKVKAGWASLNIGDTLLLQGKAVEAQPYLEQSLTLFQQVGTRVGILGSTSSLSRAAMQLGDVARAWQLAETASQMAQQIHSASWLRRIDDLLQSLDPEIAQNSPTTHHSEEGSLSERELEVLQLLKSELTGPEIARRLVVSLNTVRFHTKHIYQKLGASNRLEAIRRARELGL